jgi:hypothetical protein
LFDERFIGLELDELGVPVNLVSPLIDVDRAKDHFSVFIWGLQLLMVKAHVIERLREEVGLGHVSYWRLIIWVCSLGNYGLATRVWSLLGSIECVLRCALILIAFFFFFF